MERTNPVKGVLKNLVSLLPDKAFLRLRYHVEMGRRLDLNNPKTMNEKLQWLKLYDRNPLYTALVDKIQVKEFIKKKIGEEYVAKTLGVWKSFDEIDFSMLPEKFVLKTNHSGGNTGVVICKDKEHLDIKTVRRKMERSLRTDIYKLYREWPYKNVPRRIFAEEYLEDSVNEELTDYKFYCFDGYVDAVMLCLDRMSGSPKFYFFDKEWRLRRYNRMGKEVSEGFTLPRPKNMDRMFDIASQLSKGIPFVRVDMYNIGGRIIFGEMTFYPASGFDRNRLPETDQYFGNLINLKLCSDTLPLND